MPVVLVDPWCEAMLEAEIAALASEGVRAIAHAVFGKNRLESDAITLMESQRGVQEVQHRGARWSG